MRIKFLADALVTREIVGRYARFRLLTHDAREWWADNVEESWYGKDDHGAYIVTEDADAADIFMRMAEDGIRIATERGVTVVGYIGAA